MKSRIVILGAGESGVGAALLAQAQGYDVFVSDRSPIESKFKYALEQAAIAFEEGKHSEEKILVAHEIIKSPGIPVTVPLITRAKSAGIPVIGELEFASRYTRAKFIGITGTNGKTTTTLLTYHLLKEAGLNVGLAGNVGSSLAKQVIDDRFDYYVVEISSFQLDDMVNFKPSIAILLNITPDHLDRYEGSIELYATSKFGIAKNLDESTPFIYNWDDPEIRRRLDRLDSKLIKIPVSVSETLSEGGFKLNDKLHFNVGTTGKPFAVFLNDIPLKGRHNVINAMAAVIATLKVGISGEDIIQGLKSFKNAPHRMEDAGKINGISFINDSKATNIDAVYYALEGFKEPLVWIAGGIDKGNNYDRISELVKKNVKALVCLGKDNIKLKKAFRNYLPIEEENQSMQGAVEKAFALASEGDVVLLSPACASFDLFKNYEDRGNQFKNAVEVLRKRIGEESLN